MATISMTLWRLLMIMSTCSAFATWGPHRPTTSKLAAVSDECVKTAEILSLESIRSTLIRQEETIIFALIERAQFRQNEIVYRKGGFGDLGCPLGSKPSADDDEELSFLEFMLMGTEALHCGVRRYTSPEEHAFFPDRLPNGPMDNMPALDYPDLLMKDASDVNFNPILFQKYTQDIIPSLTRHGDDEQHGSCTLCDIQCLQVLSRRVHYGKFVAESKYRADPDAYQRLVDANDAEGVMELLTNAQVEKLVLRRARLKAATYGREPLLNASLQMEEVGSVDETTSIVAAAAASAVVAAVEAMKEDANDDEGSNYHKVDPKVIESIYKDIIIPLTKDVEVAYLFRRCGKDPPPEFAPDRMSIDCNTQEAANGAK